MEEGWREDEVRADTSSVSAALSTSDPKRTVVAEWIHFTLFGIMLPTIKLKVYTFGAYELSN